MYYISKKKNNELIDFTKLKNIPISFFFEKKLISSNKEIFLISKDEILNIEKEAIIDFNPFLKSGGWIIEKIHFNKIESQIPVNYTLLSNIYLKYNIPNSNLEFVIRGIVDVSIIKEKNDYDSIIQNIKVNEYYYQYPNDNLQKFHFISMPNFFQ